MALRPLPAAALALLLPVLAACGAPASQATHRAAPKTTRSSAAHRALAPLPWGSTKRSSILPGDILIADSHNNRILLVTPQKKIVWQFPAAGQPTPLYDDDDVFFSPDFQQIITNEEGDNVIAILDFKTRRVLWTYGHAGVAGSAPGYLDTPDDAFLYQTPEGQVVTLADIKNQRILFIDRKTKRILKQYGVTGVYSENPPATYAAPNGDFPAPQGGMLVTQIGGNDAVWLDKQGKVLRTIHFPADLSYPSDANITPQGDIICAFYTKPGGVVIMSPQGRVLWRYSPSSGSGMLNQPSLAVELKNGLVLLNDDMNDRVIVIDPKTDKIVWQYGHTGVPGSARGYLDVPDGLDILPAGIVPGAKNPVGGHLWSYPGNGY